jgi:predicted DNA-binding transcriptional regulator YafY
LRDQKRVRLAYQNGNQPETIEREFDPYALAYRSGWWYVIGYCHLRNDIRSFRVDRIRRFEALTDPYSIPADFDAQAYLKFEVQAEQGMLVKMQIEADYAYLATGTPAFWESLETQPDGSVIVTTRLIDIYRAAGFVFSYGPAATVLEPSDLRDLIHTWSTELVAQYNATGHPES